MIKKLILGLPILILLASIAGYTAFYRTECTENKAYTILTGYITNKLVAPLSAIFPKIDEIKITKEADKCVFAVTGYVDSSNAFNALIRTHYFAKVFYKDDKWSVYLQE